MMCIQWIRRILPAVGLLVAALAAYSQQETKVKLQPANAGNPGDASAAADNAIRIQLPPVKRPGEGWRLAWNSTPGKAYRLQRWATDDLQIAAPIPWVDVATIVATSAVASVDDPTSIDAPRRYYRIMQLPDDAGDLIPPIVEPLTAKFTSEAGLPLAALSVVARDNVGVSRITFFNGSQELGPGKAGPSNQWTFALPINPRELGARFLSARAIDAAGNVANSPIFPLGLVDPDHFVPLGSDGLPIEGGIVQATAPGEWGPVEYRPGGRNMLGFGPGFFLRFPNGVRLINQSGLQFLEFTNAMAGFGVKYPIQLTQSLARNGGPAKRIRFGPANLTEVLEVFDMKPEAGIEVRIFNRFTLRWHAGIVDDGGIKGARFGVQGTGLPLPSISGNYPDLQIDFTQSRGVRIPFHGEFSLPDGTATPLRLRAGIGAPIWLKLDPDGGVGLSGSADALLPGGGHLRVDVGLNDPVYDLQFAAAGLQLRTLSSFADLLPASPGVCLPGTPESAQLTAASRCLTAFARAYGQFSATVAAALSKNDASEPNQSETPPEPATTVSSVVEAWASSALATTAQQLPLSLAREAIQQLGQSATGSTSLEDVLRARLALMRATQAVQSNASSSSADSRAELEAALTGSESAATALAGATDVILNLENMTTAMQLIAETETVRQELGRTQTALMTTALPSLFQRFADRYTAALGIQTGAFTPAGNNIVNGLSRYVAADHLRKLVGLLGTSQIPGLDANASRIDEALSQLAIRSFETASADAVTAERSGDYPGFLMALLDVLDVASARQLAIFPANPGLNAFLPGQSEVENFVRRLNTLLEQDLGKPLGDRTFNNLHVELRALTKVLRQLPASVALAPVPLRRTFDSMEAALNLAVGGTALDSVNSLFDLLQILEAGTLHAELGRRLSPAPAIQWESQRLPLVVARLGSLAQLQGGWSQLNQGVRFLIDTADRLALVNDQVRRKIYLEQSAALLAGGRTIARSLNQKAAPILQTSDLLLPGEIRVDKVSGSIHYNRFSGDVSGALNGTLQLPKFGTALTINNASFGRGGSFDIQAFGQVRIPGDNPALTATISSGDPVHLSWSSRQGLQLTGGASFTLGNGMSFKGSIGLVDPVYRFSLEAGGLEFGLLNSMLPKLPPLPAEADFRKNGVLDSAALDLWSTFYDNLEKAVNGVTPQALPAVTTGPADTSSPGQPVDPNDSRRILLRAWGNMMALGDHYGTSTNLTPTLPGAGELALNVRRSESFRLNQFAVREGEFHASSAQAQPAGPPFVAPSFEQVLQFDFGRPNDDFQISAPPVPPAAGQAIGAETRGSAGDFTVLPPNVGRWNAVGQHGPERPLVYADDAPANGIVLDLGRTAGAFSDVVVTDREPDSSVLLDVEHRIGGIYDSIMMDDGLKATDLLTDQDDAIAVRILGLPPGFYYAVTMIGHRQGEHRRDQILTGTDHTRVNQFDVQTMEAPADLGPNPGWREGMNYVVGRAVLTAPGQELVVVSRANPTPADRGPFSKVSMISGLQILRPQARLLSFEAETNRIQLGKPARLRWSARHFETITLRGTDGSVQRVTGNNIEVTPVQTTDYTLTVENRNGPPQEMTLRITVLGDNTQAENIRDLVEQSQNEDCDIRALIEDCAIRQLRGETCPPELEELQRVSAQNDQDIITRLLSTDQCRKTGISDAISVMRFVASRAGDRGNAGFDDTQLITAITDYATCIGDEAQRRLGLKSITKVPNKPDVVELDTNAIQVISLEAGVRSLPELLTLQATAQTFGGDTSLSSRFLEAHADNLIAKILGSFPSNQPAALVGLQASLPELELYVKGFQLAGELFKNAGIDPATRPGYRQAEADLAQIAQLTLDRIDREFLEFRDDPFSFLRGRGFWASQFDSIKTLDALNKSGRADMATAIQARALKILEIMDRESESGGDLRGSEPEVLKFVQPYLAVPRFRELYERRIVRALEFISSRMPPTRSWTPEEFRSAPGLINSLADLHVLIKTARSLGATITIPDNIRVELMGVRMILNAEEAVRRSTIPETGKPTAEAVASLNAFNRAIVANRMRLDASLADPRSRCRGLPAVRAFAAGPTPEPDTLASAWAGEWYRTVKLAGENAERRRQELQQAQASSLFSDLKLPAGFKVDRVFGEFYFNRMTGFLQGGFGGRVVFPQEKITLDIRNASLATDGNFSIDAGTSAPLPFGQIGLNANLRFRSAPGAGLTVAGDGQIRVPVNNTMQVFDAALAYDQSANRLSATTTGRNLNLKFTDDFVLFDAGFGFDVSLNSPNGKFTALGSAGLFAKQKPLTGSLTRTNFHLFAEAITTSFDYSANGFAARLENGILRLPDLFHPSICPTNTPGFITGPALTLSSNSPITISYRNSPESVSFNGALDLGSVGFSIPGLTNFAVEVCSATLAFPSNSLPELRNLNASVQLPIPGQTNRVDLIHASWSLTGFPTGTMRLRDDLRLFENGGFTFSVLGLGTNSAGTRLTVTNTSSGPLMELAGGIELGVPGSILSGQDGSTLKGRVDGLVSVRPDRQPEFVLGNLSINAQGGFRLGGSTNGLLVQDASLIAEGASNLFRLDANHVFTLRLGGKVGIPNGPQLGLDNARFIFDGSGLPKFSFREARFDTQGQLQLAQGFPISVSSGSLRLKNQDLRFPQLLNPTNLVVGLSAQVNIPPGEHPVVTGQVDDLQLQLENGILTPSVDGIGFGISALEIPPLSLSGRMFIGGLRSSQARAFAPAAAGSPRGIYFVGKLGGKFNGIGLIATVAMDLQGIIGVCIDPSLGPAGIPLDPSGFILTGAAGGIAFGGISGDPCEFTTFFPMDNQGRPIEGSSQQAGAARQSNRQPGVALSWEEYALLLERTAHEQDLFDKAGARGIAPAVLANNRPQGFERSAAAAAASEQTLSCPTGDCPPASVNILAQPHPDSSRYPNRIIFKFSSLDEDFLNDIGITRSFVDGLGLTTADGIAANVATRVREAIRNVTPVADPALLGPDLARQLNQLVDAQLVQLQGILEDILRASLQPVLQDKGRVYNAIVEAAYAGIPFPNSTLSLHGTISHVTVSTFLSGTVGVVVSGQIPIPNLPVPPGSSGVTGTINLLGVPVGFGKAFLTTVDGRGAINPSFCGDMLLALGPLELGRGKMELKCDGCSQTMLNTFGQLVTCLGQATVNSVLSRVAPGKSLGQLTDQEKLGFLAHLFSQPPNPNLAPCFLTAAQSSFQLLDPRFTYCAEFRPRLFGLPLSASIVGIHATASKTGIAAAFDFSPSFLIGNLILCTSTAGQFCQPIFPALDNATIGFGLGFPDPSRLIAAGLEGRLSSAQTFNSQVQEGFDHVLADATYTIGYEFSPFGLRALNAQARVVTPNLTAHPARPGFNYIRPEDRNRGLPSRRELILAALDRDLLKDPLWKGSSEDIHRAFPEGSAQRTALQGSGLNFSTDYFPHGGMLGAARLTLPKMLVDAPPAELAQLFAPTNTPLDKLGAGVQLIQNYILSASDVGALAFYVPAPNPPVFTTPQGRPLAPADLLAGMQTFDPSRVSLGSLYPLEQAFLGGYIDGRLLGIPLGRAQVEAVPADAVRGVSAHFKVLADIPGDSWMRSFVEGARMSFEIRQSPALPLDAYFAGLAARIAARTNSVDALLSEMQNSLADSMPKVSLELAITNLHTPPELAALLTPSSAGGRLVAYSPRFNPSFAGTNPIALVTREGGIALQGSFRFANLVTVANAELAVSPRPVGLPKIAGDFNVPFVGVNNIGLRDARLIFNSEPAIQQPFLLVSGGVDPLRIGIPGQDPIVEITPLVSGATRLSGNLSAVRAANGSVATAFSFSPSRANIPLLGTGVTVVVHGATTNDNFGFASDQPWTNNITIRGSIALRDPTGVEVLRFGDPQQRFAGTLSGNGLTFQSIDLRFPASVRVTAFPGKGSPLEQVLDLGSPTNQARLFVSADGRFEVSGAVGGPLNFPGLPVTGLAAGASFSMKPTGLTLGGTFQGGSIVKFIDQIGGTLVLSPGGITSLTGSAVLDPVRFGNLVLEGMSRPTLTAQLTKSGLALPDGARLRIEGLRADVLQLAPFTNQANGDFTAKLTVSSLNIPGSFRLASGNMELRKAGEVVTLQIEAPTLTVFPGETFATTFSSPLERVVVETTGRFYADTGRRDIALPGLFTASGNLEFGFEPDDRPARLQVLTPVINFGDQGIGLASTKTITLTNSGLAPLQISLVGTNRAFTLSPASFSLPSRAIQNVQVTFLPAAAGPATNTFEIFSNAGNGPHTVLASGSGRTQPIYAQTANELAFGEHALNSTTTKSFSIRNLGTLPFQLSAVEITPPFSLSPAIPSQSILPGSNVNVSVRYAPSAAGTVSGTVTIRTNGSTVAGRVTLSGTGFDERWVLLKDGGVHLRGLAQFGTRSLFAVGDDGAFLTSTNGGDSWAQRPGFDTRDLNAISIDQSAKTPTLVAAGSGGALISTNLGKSWRVINHPGVNVSNAVWTGAAHVGTNGLVLAGRIGSRGMILRQSGATNFVPAAAPPRGMNSLAVGIIDSGSLVPATKTLLIAAGDDGVLLVSENLGTNWSNNTIAGSPRNRILGAALSQNGIGLAVGEAGLLIRRNFGSALATSWTPVNGLPIKRTLNAVAISGSTAYAVGSGGLVLRSTDAGLTWSVEQLPGQEAALAVVTDGNSAYTAGGYGQIHHRPAQIPSQPLLAYSAPVLDFGAIQPGDVRRQVVEVFNRGGAPLNLTNISISGTGFSVSPTVSTTLAPGSSRSLTISLTGSAIGKPTGELRLKSNDPDLEHRVSLNGVVRSNVWTKLSSGGTQTFADVQFLTSSIGYAIAGRQVFKSVDGGLTWAASGPPAPGPLRSMHFISSNIGWAVGGDDSLFNLDCSGDCRSTIWKTSDGGTTWASQPSSVSSAISDIHMTSSAAGFIATRSSLRITGEVLRTVNGGASWQLVTRPVPASGTFSGTAIHAAGSTVFAAGSGHLFRSTDNGTNWTRVLDLPDGATINDIEFVGSAGWVAGNGGFFRTTTTGGASPSSWTSASFPYSVADLQFSKIDFQLTSAGRLSGARSDGSSVLFHSADSGATWVEELAENADITGAGSVRSVAVLTGNFGVAVGTGGNVWKLSRFAPAPQGTPLMPARTELSDISPGAVSTVSLLVTNLGPGILNVSRIELQSDDSIADFVLNTPSLAPIDSGKTGTISVTVAGKKTGRQRAVLLLTTDGFGGNSRCDLSMDVGDVPASVVFETQPPGLALLLNGLSTIAPVSRGIVRDDPAPGQWALGSTNRIEAPLTQTNSGVVWRFQRWDPADDRAFDYVAAEAPQTFRAIYVSSSTSGPAQPLKALSVQESPARQGFAKAAVAPSFDPPTGPYLRLSAARIGVPALGDLNVQGDVFLSAESISAALNSGGFRIPKETIQPGVLELGAESWSFDYSRNSRLRLLAHGPDVTVLENPVLPPSSLELNFEKNGNFTATFATTDDLSVVNGLFEMGPGRISLERRSFLSMTVTGEARALKGPDGSFAIRQPVDFKISEGPFTFALTNLPSTLLNLGAIRVTRENAASGFHLSRNSSGDFSAAVSNINFSIFGAPSTRVSAAAQNNVLTIQAGGSIPMGPFSLDHTSSSGKSTINWNLRNGSVVFDMPGMLLKSATVPGWPSAGVQFPPAHFNSSGDFNHTVLLPNMEFDGVSLRDATDPDKHYLQLKRQSQKAEVHLRDERDFLGNVMKVGFDLKQTSTVNPLLFSVSGFFRGSVALQDTPGLGDISLGYIDLNYNSARQDFQFQGLVETPIADFSVKFGRNGGQICHLFCDDAGNCSPGLFCLP